MIDHALRAKSTIVFHPGIGKTGTSAIQHTGLNLPIDDINQPCFLPFGIAAGAHNQLAMNHPLFDAENFDENIQRTIAFVSGRNASTIISSEFLSRLTNTQLKEMLQKFETQGIRVKALFSIRSYEGFLMSSYMQAIKAKYGREPGEDLVGFCNRELEFIRYHILIDRWAQLIGDNSIYLLDYDEYKDSIVVKFFDLFGITPEAYETIDNKKVNLSVPICFDEVLDAFDMISDNELDREKLIEFLIHAEPRQSIIDTKISLVRETVTDKYAHDRARLTNRYTWV